MNAKATSGERKKTALVIDTYTQNATEMQMQMHMQLRQQMRIQMNTLQIDTKQMNFTHNSHKMQLKDNLHMTWHAKTFHENL